MQRLVQILSNAYALGLQAQDGKVNAELAEEVTGECAELIALLTDDHGAFGDDECIDPELIRIAHLIKEVA